MANNNGTKNATKGADAIVIEDAKKIVEAKGFTFPLTSRQNALCRAHFSNLHSGMKGIAWLRASANLFFSADVAGVATSWENAADLLKEQQAKAKVSVSLFSNLMK